MELDEIVMKLVGPVQPTGEHEVDTRRLSNMETLTGLVEELLTEIEVASRDADDHRISVRDIGRCARSYLNGLFYMGTATRKGEG